MSDSFFYTMELNDESKEYEIFFTVRDGYVSTDPFEPSEPDEIEIVDVSFDDDPVAYDLYLQIIEEYEDILISNIKNHLMEGVY